MQRAFYILKHRDYEPKLQYAMQIPEIFNFFDVVVNHVTDFFISFSFNNKTTESIFNIDGW